MSRRQYETAHLAIVVAYTLFCAAVLGIEHPIYRFLAAIATSLPILWAVWVLARARLPAETMEERLKEETKFATTGGRYRRLTAELLALSGEAKELDQVASQVDSGEISRDEGFERLNRIEHRMKRRVERMRGLVKV